MPCVGLLFLSNLNFREIIVDFWINFLFTRVFFLLFNFYVSVLERGDCTYKELYHYKNKKELTAFFFLISQICCFLLSKSPCNWNLFFLLLFVLESTESISMYVITGHLAVWHNLYLN